MTAPLSESEARWAKSIGLLQKKEGYFDTLKSDPRKAVGCILGALFVLATIGCVIFVMGVL